MKSPCHFSSLVEIPLTRFFFGNFIPGSGSFDAKNYWVKYSLNEVVIMRDHKF